MSTSSSSSTSAVVGGGSTTNMQQRQAAFGKWVRSCVPSSKASLIPPLGKPGEVEGEWLADVLKSGLLFYALFEKFMADAAKEISAFIIQSPNEVDSRNNLQLVVDALRKLGEPIPEVPVQEMQRQSDWYLKLLWHMIHLVDVASVTFSSMKGEDALLSWCQESSQVIPNVVVKDLTSPSWCDGRAMLSLICAHKGDKVDIKAFIEGTPAAILKFVFSVLEQAGVPLLLTAEDIARGADSQALVIFLAKIYHILGKAPAATKASTKPIRQKATLTKMSPPAAMWNQQSPPTPGSTPVYGLAEALDLEQHLSDTELSNFSPRITVLEKENAELKSKLAAQQASHAEEVEAYENEHATVLKELEDLKKRVSSASPPHTKCAGNCTSEISSLRKALAEEAEKVKQAERGISELKRQYTKCNTQLETTKSQCVEATGRFQTAEGRCTELTDTLQKRNAHVSNLETQIITLMRDKTSPVSSSPTIITTTPTNTGPISIPMLARVRENEGLYHRIAWGSLIFLTGAVFGYALRSAKRT
ncbi:hypothetical protein Pelo_7361 [Pelomyxa schiedti]|nr:hypothetical protein Pelo_7361 [Pelomyxa schiedti]